MKLPEGASSPPYSQGRHSGAGMDRAISAGKWRIKGWVLKVGAALCIAGLGTLVLRQSFDRSATLDNNHIVVSEVSEGLFEDYIPIRGQVTPRKTVFLDLVEGGRVEERRVEDGSMVEAGDLIVVLTNTSLQLEVMRNEAIVTEQLNNMRTIELQLEQNRLSHKRELVELDYNIIRLRRRVDRLATLDNAGVATRSELESAQDELLYYTRRREVSLESQQTDTRLQETQLSFLKESSAQLEESLALARKNLDALNVRAPVEGKLSGLDVEVGQSVARGGRIGQIDDPTSFKLQAEVDEYYLGRVAIGQEAHVERNGKQYPLSVSKMYPQVHNGEFTIDLTFKEAEPSDIRRGQTLESKLVLGDSTNARLIPNGSFYQDTGGSWVFVVTEDGSEAFKREIKLGRRNAHNIEILEGLETGEKVITSPYSGFRDMDRLTLKQK